MWLPELQIAHGKLMFQNFENSVLMPIYLKFKHLTGLAWLFLYIEVGHLQSDLNSKLAILICLVKLLLRYLNFFEAVLRVDDQPFLGYGHLPDIILLNDGRGLGDTSESCLGMEKSKCLDYSQ